MTKLIFYDVKFGPSYANVMDFQNEASRRQYLEDKKVLILSDIDFDSRSDCNLRLSLSYDQMRQNLSYVEVVYTDDQLVSHSEFYFVTGANVSSVKQNPLKYIVVLDLEWDFWQNSVAAFRKLEFYKCFIHQTHLNRWRKNSKDPQYFKSNESFDGIYKFYASGELPYSNFDNKSVKPVTALISFSEVDGDNEHLSFILYPIIPRHGFYIYYKKSGTTDVWTFCDYEDFYKNLDLKYFHINPEKVFYKTIITSLNLFYKLGDVRQDGDKYYYPLIEATYSPEIDPYLIEIVGDSPCIYFPMKVSKDWRARSFYDLVAPNTFQRVNIERLTPIKPVWREKGLIRNVFYEPRVFLEPFMKYILTDKLSQQVIALDSFAVLKHVDITYNNYITIAGVNSTVYFRIRGGGTNYENATPGYYAPLIPLSMDFTKSSWYTYALDQRQKDIEFKNYNNMMSYIVTPVTHALGGLVGGSVVQGMLSRGHLMDKFYKDFRDLTPKDRIKFEGPYKQSKYYPPVGRRQLARNLEGFNTYLHPIKYPLVKKLMGKVPIIGTILGFGEGLIEADQNARAADFAQEQLEWGLKNTPASATYSKDGMSNVLYQNFYNYIVAYRVNDEVLNGEYENIYNCGYKYDSWGIPDIYSRRYFNYIQTQGCLIKNKMSNSERSMLQTIFDNGVRVWHYENLIADDCEFLDTKEKENIENILVPEVVQ